MQTTKYMHSIPVQQYTQYWNHFHITYMYHMKNILLSHAAHISINYMYKSELSSTPSLTLAQKSGSHMTNNGIQKCEHIFKCFLEIQFKHHEIKKSGNVPI